MKKEKASNYRYWSGIMEEFTKSGLSQEQFCRNNNVPYYKFKYYRHRLKKVAKEAVTQEDMPASTPVTFAPIKVTCPSPKPETTSMRLHLRLPNHLVLEFTEGIYPETLVRLVKALKPC